MGLVNEVPSRRLGLSKLSSLLGFGVANAACGEDVLVGGEVWEVWEEGEEVTVTGGGAADTGGAEGSV